MLRYNTKAAIAISYKRVGGADIIATTITILITTITILIITMVHMIGEAFVLGPFVSTKALI
ncbi:MAG: hypothetical protein A2X70_02750 [Alphaproteobacteria bacterium GWC2_42_16]|nr:MAG: hypothetical protein A2X70_02750 [Alphaproteobacteria bacterium GWC2_42_16]OFW74581.1 MAG: hypothetical protein A2Z80_04145 [Alphaproteobacteria bacterium GWA2_41_27]OFW84853.1 MAG: hypothetical protein A3E50_02340 [Alphaproteobacteria bacterium RIFCSPHIGHO2_12_FULL_42_100]OFW86578.1 MAG: hypothetical protein A2W06_06995 [Alphaproteobacteria bacterium RBG_16_42_14]OFW91839.1 MAG: hypothetical protein A2W46_07825 [Alphaproteobacteria bacterium RIFCSPHIGHO2_12_42_13]OFW92872.1 MAG: hypot